MDVVEQHIPRILEQVRKFKGSDQEFATFLKEEISNFVSVLVIELEDGFGNYNDV